VALVKTRKLTPGKPCVVLLTFGEKATRLRFSWRMRAHTIIPPDGNPNKTNRAAYDRYQFRYVSPFGQPFA
jgi:hypothetical protein